MISTKEIPKFTRGPRYNYISPTEDDAKNILSILYTNRSKTHLYLNNSRQAVMDATYALYSNIHNGDAFIARGKASIEMNNCRSAYEDFIEALKLNPESKEIFDLSTSAFQRIKQQEILEELQSSNNGINSLDKMKFFPYQLINEKDYDFDSFSANDAKEICDIVKRFELLKPEVVIEMMNRMCDLLRPLPNIVKISNVKEVIVVGDTHGQLQDVLSIFKKYGYPTAERPYLFNGDYVDRGSQGLEILLILAAWKLVGNDCIYINRGNHETISMNEVYGFTKECEMKLGREVFDSISRFFEHMPFAHIICDKVFVVHGGICAKKGMDIASLQKVNRFVQPPEEGPLNDILWSDPMDKAGVAESVRGGAILFGPDVTDDFLSTNGLELIIRSHQAIQEGFKIQHGGKCVTVFSAPNYIGKLGNIGCVARIKFDNEGKLLPTIFETFKARPIPFDFPPMIYADMRRFA